MRRRPPATAPPLAQVLTELHALGRPEVRAGLARFAIPDAAAIGVPVGELRALARRVGQSAKDIEALIQTVKEQTQAAIASMEVGTREVLGGSELVTSTLTGLGMLITVVKDTATAVHEQAVVSDEIARNMDAVRGLAGEALHGSEESVVQAERLHELAFELEESIGGFNLDGSKLGGSTPKRVEAPAKRALPSAPRTKPAKPRAEGRD